MAKQVESGKGVAKMTTVFVLLLSIAVAQNVWVEMIRGARQASLPSSLWFTQPLDHFNPQDDRTWQQQYLVNSSFFAQGGPIFFQVGGEAPITEEYVSSFAMSKYAATYSALQVTLEHRFYGSSMPLPDFSTKNLAYLSIEQALADAADFIKFLKTKYPVAGKVVAFGGSYPGNLAAWLRMKFPTLVDLAIASSAPVLAVVDMLSYLEVTGNSLAAIGGQACEDAVRNASLTIEQILKAPTGAATLSTMFATCVPINESDWLSLGSFSHGLMSPIQQTVQYSRYTHHNGLWQIADVCAIMENPTQTPLENYVQLSSTFRGSWCLYNSYGGTVTYYRDIQSPYRSWLYQTCTQVGYFQSTDSPTQPFGTLAPLQFSLQLCADIFDLNMTELPRVAEVNTMYGGNDVRGASRVMFVNCDLDQWSSLSVLKSQSPSLPALVIANGSHCCNMNSDPTNPAVIAAQKQISQQIGTWLTAAPPGVTKE